MPDEGVFEPGDYVDRLPSFLNPLKVRARKLVTPEATSCGEVVSLSRVRWYGYQACLAHLFAPAREEWITRFEGRFGAAIPRFYKDFLLAMNGADILDLHLYGLAPSLQGDPPLLDRSRVQPLDLGSAHSTWKAGFLFSGGKFHFGVRPHRGKFAGFFWNAAKNRFETRSRFGFHLGSWSRFEDFLEAELSGAEERFRALEVSGVRPSPTLPA